MVFYGINFAAVMIAAIAAWLFGALYYTPLGKYWLAAQDKTAEEVKCGSKTGLARVTPFILSFISEVLMAAILAALIIRTGPVTVSNGLKIGLMVWFGFMLTTMAVNYSFAARKPLLTLIDAVHWLGVIVVMAAIIGFFGF